MVEAEWLHIELLSRPSGHPAAWPLPDGVRLAELGPGDAARIAAAARAQGQQRSPERIAARFALGLRHFVLEAGGETAAWLWLAAGVPRYIDELCWSVAMAPGQAWVRDSLVAPARRGQRLYAALLDAVTARLDRPTEYFVDIDVSNASSLRAHAAMGFVPLARVRALATPWLVLRPRPPAALPPVQALRPRRRVLRLSRSEREWHRAHIA